MAKLRYSFSTHQPHMIFQPQSLLATIHSRKRNIWIDPFVSLRACDRANFCHASHVSRHFSFNSMEQFRRCESAFGNASSQKRLLPTTINLSPRVVNAYRMSSFSVSLSSVVPFTRYKNTYSIANYRDQLSPTLSIIYSTLSNAIYPRTISSIEICLLSTGVFNNGLERKRKRNVTTNFRLPSRY